MRVFLFNKLRRLPLGSGVIIWFGVRTFYRYAKIVQDNRDIKILLAAQASVVITVAAIGQRIPHVPNFYFILSEDIFGPLHLSSYSSGSTMIYVTKESFF